MTTYHPQLNIYIYIYRPVDDKLSTRLAAARLAGGIHRLRRVVSWLRRFAAPLAATACGGCSGNRLRRLQAAACGGCKQPPAAVAGSRLRRLPKIIYLLKPKNQKISIFTQIGSFHRNQRKHLMVYPQSRSFFRFFDFFDFFGHFGGPGVQGSSGPAVQRSSGPVRKISKWHISVNFRS